MPRRSDIKLTKRMVDALSVEKNDAVFWDRELAGFGVRVYATSRKVYVVQSRGPWGPKRVTLGRHGEMSCEEARKQAALVIDRIKRGEIQNPSRPRRRSPWLALPSASCATTSRRAASPTPPEHTAPLIENHVEPALGGMAVAQVGRAEVAALHHVLRATPTVANAVLRLLLQNVQDGRVVGPGSPREQPVPGVAPLPDAGARAVPDTRGVPAAWAGR